MVSNGFLFSFPEKHMYYIRVYVKTKEGCEKWREALGRLTS